MYVFIYIYIYIYIYIHTHTYIQVYIYTCVYIYIYTTNIQVIYIIYNPRGWGGHRRLCPLRPAARRGPGALGLYYTILYYTILYSTMLCYAMLCYAMLYYTMLYCTILYCTILYYTMVSRRRPRKGVQPGGQSSRFPSVGWRCLSKRCLSNTASFVLCAVYSVKDHHTLLHNSKRLKKTCVRQVALDK